MATPLGDKSAGLLLSLFQDVYKQELGAEEDVHRTLPFFATALGLIVTALVFAVGHFALLARPYDEVPSPDSHRSGLVLDNRRRSGLVHVPMVNPHSRRVFSRSFLLHLLGVRVFGGGHESKRLRESWRKEAFGSRP